MLEHDTHDISLNAVEYVHFEYQHEVIFLNLRWEEHAGMHLPDEREGSALKTLTNEPHFEYINI